MDSQKIETYFYILTKSKKFSAIVDRYQKLNDPISALVHYLAGNAYFQIADYSNAIIAWQLALDTDESLGFIRHRVEQLQQHPDAVTGERLLYPEEPLVHVLILTMNRMDYLRRTMRCLGKTSYTNYKVFLLDNCSTDGTRDLLPNLRSALPSVVDYTYDSLPTNIGRPGGHNWLLTNWDHSDADYIAILDDDLLHFEPNWLKIFLNTFTLKKDLGAVGSKTLMMDGKIQDAFPILTGIGNGTDVHFFTHRGEENIGQYDYFNNIPDYVTGCSSLFKKEVFIKVGLFDIRYSPSQYVDIDHGIRMRQANYDLMYNGNVSVVHAQLTHEERKKSRAAKGNQRGNAYKMSQKYEEEDFYKLIRERTKRESIFSMTYKK